MARQRRGGFRPPELRGTLGTLLRTTLAQAGVVRDALERGAREGRSRLDEARANRKRNDALGELGEIVLQLIRDGEIDAGELPEVRDVVARLDEIDARDDARVDEPPPLARATSRARFDDRGRDARDARADRADRDNRDDGTVSSRTARELPTRRTAARVWRPTAEPSLAVDDEQPTAPERPARMRAAANHVAKKGGISFDDDDLSDYMHSDDVPPKKPPEGDA